MPNSARAHSSSEGMFELKTVLKTIHDCRKDCDALYHQIDIGLQHVHDVSCYHLVVSGTEMLISMMCWHVMAFLPTRLGTTTHSICSSNFTFWATRPMTPRMKMWAAGDVTSCLFSPQSKAQSSRQEQDPVGKSCQTICHCNQDFCRYDAS